MNQFNFICFNKKYPINLKIFNKVSKFFSQNENKNQTQNDLQLLSETDQSTSHSEESISAFIQSCQHQQIEITIENVISLRTLSDKYFMIELYKDTEKYIQEHYHEVIEYFLTNLLAYLVNFNFLSIFMGQNDTANL